MEVVKTYQNSKNETLSIYPDENPISPREWDNIGTIVTMNGLGDEKGDRTKILDYVEHLTDKQTRQIVLDTIKKDKDSKNDLYVTQGNYEDFIIEYYGEDMPEDVFDDIAKFLQDNKKLVVLPVYKYQHSCIVLNTAGFACPWDSGQTGYVYADEKAIEEFKGDIDKVIVCLKNEIETFSHYCNGEVYGFTIEDKDGGHIESIWGFYGQDFENNGIFDYADRKEWEEVA